MQLGFLLASQMLLPHLVLSLHDFISDVLSKLLFDHV
jgi:hypothetical protein